MSIERELLARLDRLTDALERSSARQRERAPQPTYGEQVRAGMASPCRHGEPRGSDACPLCRRGL